MAAPSAWKPNRIGRTLTFITGAETTSFTQIFSTKGCAAMTVITTGTIGTGTWKLEGSMDGVTIVAAGLALQQAGTVGHTELVTINVLGIFSLNLNDLAIPFFQLDYTAAGGSSITFGVAAIQI